ncbi:MAG: nitrilase-related carbon-nitrogen hydrolase [Gammaproteobacteria bacterium]
MICVTSVQYEIGILKNWQDYCEKVERLVLETKKNSNLLVLPEYAGCEIACGQYDTDLKLYQHIQPAVPDFIAFYSSLSQKHDLYILPGTILIEVKTNQFVNRAYFFSPSGEYGFQDKLRLTVYEKLKKNIVPGEKQTVFETSFGKIGIAICYDVEFPELIRPLVLAGVKLILVPSYTNSAAGAARVLYCARARAIENQCYIVTASVVGPMTLTREVEHCQGVTAILCPADKRFPNDGLLAQTQTEGPALVTANLDFMKLDWVRKHGNVRNFLDAHDCSPTPVNTLSLYTLHS